MPETNIRSTATSLLNQDVWEELLDSLEEEKCILCIGPGLYSQLDELRLEQQLADFLREKEEDLRIRVYEDGWFHYLSGSHHIRAVKRVKEFYKRPNPKAESILQKIAAIPFHFILNFTPDYKLKNAFDQQNFQSDFKSYIKKEPFDKNVKVPNKSKPLVFNILGEIDKQNSMVTGFDDFYQYLESIFERHSMSPKLQENIFEAEYFLFLGISLDKWYMHLFMRILKQHSEKKGSAKFAFSLPAEDDKVASHCFEQYSMTSISQNIGKFVDEFHQKCADKDMLRQPTTSEKIPLIPFQELRELFVNNKFEKLFDLVLNALQTGGTTAKEWINLTFNLQSQYNDLKRKRMMNLLREDDYNIQISSIRKSIIDLTTDLENNYPNPSEL